jgi:hypothetical protein
MNVFSLHFPKTGGTSFRASLEEIYGEYFLPYYPNALDQGYETHDCFKGYRCVHGHLSLDKYLKFFEGIHLITWLRDSVDRTISLYQHIKKQPHSENWLHQKVVNEKLSFYEFCEIEINHNQLFSWIGDRNPEDFQFIGFLETANSSIVRCAAALGWAYVPKFPKVNETNKGNFVKVSSNEREFLKSKNKEELLWIKKAQKIFQ